jgi:Arc/MetJ-type ribon-helix-helix transcriptional regulator
MVEKPEGGKMKRIGVRMDDNMERIIRSISEKTLFEWLEKEYARRDAQKPMKVISLALPDELYKKVRNRKLVPDKSAFIREAILRGILI